MRVNKLYHCSYSLSYHFVFVTKYRRKCFTGAMLDRLQQVVSKLCVDWDAELIEMNGEVDHVHFLLGLNPKCAPSVVANNFKTVTSRLLRKEFPALRAKYREPVRIRPAKSSCSGEVAQGCSCPRHFIADTWTLQELSCRAGGHGGGMRRSSESRLYRRASNPACRLQPSHWPTA